MHPPLFNSYESIRDSWITGQPEYQALQEALDEATIVLDNYACELEPGPDAAAWLTKLAAAHTAAMTAMQALHDGQLRLAAHFDAAVKDVPLPADLGASVPA